MTTGYFTRLARQSGLVPNPAAATVAAEAVATDLVELHEERESPPVAAPAPIPTADHEVSVGEPRVASPPRRVVPPGETSSIAASSEARGAASTAQTQPEAPRLQQPAAAEPMSSTPAQHSQSAQALHLEAVQQVVEWIAAAPQPSPPERHDVRESLPATAVTRQPARAVAEPVARTAVQPVAAAGAAVVPESPSRSTTASSEPHAVAERVVFEAPARPDAEPARTTQPPPHAEEPSGESLSVSIGSIQVTVEAPPQPVAREPAPAPHVAAPAPAPAPASSRLARHYLRPY